MRREEDQRQLAGMWVPIPICCHGDVEKIPEKSKEKIHFLYENENCYNHDLCQLEKL